MSRRKFSRFWMVSAIVCADTIVHPTALTLLFAPLLSGTSPTLPALMTRTPAVSIDSARRCAAPPRPPHEQSPAEQPTETAFATHPVQRTSFLIKTDVRRSKTSEMPLRTVHRPPGPPRNAQQLLITTHLGMVRPTRTIFRMTNFTIFWRLSSLNGINALATPRSPLTAIPSRCTSPLRRLSSSPSALVLSPITPLTTPPSFFVPCVRRSCPTVINHRPSRGW